MLCIIISIIVGGMLQTTQHDGVIGGNVCIVHFGYKPPHLSAMSSSQTLQEVMVQHVAKATPNMRHYHFNIFWSI